MHLLHRGITLGGLDLHGAQNDPFRGACKLGLYFARRDQWRARSNGGRFRRLLPSHQRIERGAKRVDVGTDTGAAGVLLDR